MDEPLRVLVFGDSLCYFGPREAMPSDDPRLWPNLLGADTRLFAGLGWTMRDAFWALTDDPAAWARLPHTDVVVLATGGMDTLPSPLPSYLRLGIRYLRPDPVRRTVRDAYVAAQPYLSRLPGRPVALPPRVSARYAKRFVIGMRSLRPDLPVIGMLPSVHRAASYGRDCRGYGPQYRALDTAFRALGVPTVDLRELTGAHVLSGAGNPDGMHWGWPAHRDVARAVSETIDTVLGRRP